MDAKVTNHNTQESKWIWDVVDVHHDIKGRTITVIDTFNNETVIDLKINDVMILAK